MISKRHYALVSGFCASGASFFGKLTGEDAANELIPKGNILVEENIWIIRLICLILMILCNALVWTFFVKALHTEGGTLVATVMSSATNYSVSFILGALVFGEEITIRTIIGMTLIITGLIFLTKDKRKEKIK